MYIGVSPYIDSQTNKGTSHLYWGFSIHRLTDKQVNKSPILGFLCTQTHKQTSEPVTYIGVSPGIGCEDTSQGTDAQVWLERWVLRQGPGDEPVLIYSFFYNTSPQGY